MKTDLRRKSDQIFWS